MTDFLPCIFALDWDDWGCWLNWLLTVAALMVFVIIFALGLLQAGALLCAVRWHHWVEDVHLPTGSRRCSRKGCKAVEHRS